ncbi:MAG: ParA family protein [Anaerolineales bacterium]|nr:ParA family protein [Anaerolineales bacterium]
MTKIITVANQKGGQAKTMTVINLASKLAENGKRVLIMDNDPQGHCAVILGIQPEPCVFNVLLGLGDHHQWVRETGRPNLSLISGDRSTATAQSVMTVENRPISAILDAIAPLLAEYDYVLFDTAPSAGGVQERSLYASKYVILPVATEFLALDGLRQINETLGQLRHTHNWRGVLLGILPTFYHTNTKESRAALSELKSAFGNSVLAPIHDRTVLRECAAEGKTIFEYAPISEAAKEYAALAQYVLKHT